MGEPFKNEWTPEMAREIDKYWGQSALETAVHIVESMGILQSCRPGDSVLEAGCGTGHIYRFLKQAPLASYTGLDSSQAMLDVFKAKFPNVPLVCGDVQALPFETDTFDVVACVEVLRHMQYYDIAIKELVRAARRVAIFTIEVTQGQDEFIGEGRKGAYLTQDDKEYLHYQVDRNAGQVLDWLSTEFSYHTDVKLVTAKKWMVAINKDIQGKSLSLAPLGGMDGFMSEVSNGLGEACKLFKMGVPGKVLKLSLKSIIDTAGLRGADFRASVVAVDDDNSRE